MFLKSEITNNVLSFSMYDLSASGIIAFLLHMMYRDDVNMNSASTTAARTLFASPAIGATNPKRSRCLKRER